MKLRWCARGRQRGFSLLEVLVAFSILALSVGVLMQIFSRALRVTAFSEDYSQAIPLAENKLNEVGLSIPLAEGEYSGTEGDGLAWTVTIQPYTSETWMIERPTLDPFLITATVLAPTSRGPRRVSLQTVRINTAF